MRRALGCLLVLVVLAGCASTASGPSVAKVEVVPGAFLLTEQGQSRGLVAVVYDASGDVMDIPVTWASSDPGAVSVDVEGLVTAIASAGAAVITASAGGVGSDPVLAVVATPGPGVVLLADASVAGEVVPVDVNAPFGPGWQYAFEVTGVPLAVGDLVLGRGEAPIAGRVVTVQPSAAGVSVVVELVPLPDLFTELVLDVSIPMVESSRLDPVAGAGALGPAVAEALAPAATFTRGRFECETDVSAPDLDLGSPDLDVTPDLALLLDYELGVGLRKLAAVGSIRADFSYKPVFEAAFTGKVTCTATLKTVTIPLNGWLAYFFGLQIPLGVGLELEGEVKVAEVGFDVQASATATAALGMTCVPATGACNALQEFDTASDFDFEFIAPEPDEQFRVDLSGHGWLFAKAAVGSAFSSAAQLELLVAQAGLKQSLSLATTVGQVDDADYASSFGLTAPMKVEAGSAITKAIETIEALLNTSLNLTTSLVDAAPSLEESPTGTFVITPATVEPGTDASLGDLAKFTIELDPVTYFGLESVEKVEIFWKKDGEDDEFTLEPARPTCTEIEGGAGKTTFECETDFLEEHRGDQTFYAFVHAKLFGVPLPVPLEIAKDAQAVVHVGSGVCPAPPAWAIPEIIDTSDPDETTEWGIGTITSAVGFDHVTVTMRSESTDSGRAWAPDLILRLEIHDYLLIVPDEPWADVGPLTLQVRQVGTAEASHTNSGCGDAEIEGYLLAGQVHGGYVHAEPTCSPDLSDSDSIDEALSWWTFDASTGWAETGSYLTGRVRSRGHESVAEATLDMKVTIERALDAEGVEVGVTVCSASGATY